MSTETRVITVAVRNDWEYLFGSVEGRDADGARGDAAYWLAGGITADITADIRAQARSLTTACIEWPVGRDLPGQDDIGDVMRSRIMQRARYIGTDLAEKLGPGAGHPDGVWGRDAADPEIGDGLWCSDEGGGPDGRSACQRVMDDYCGDDEDEVEEEARRAFVEAYIAAWDEAANA